MKGKSHSMLVPVIGPPAKAQSGGISSLAGSIPPPIEYRAQTPICTCYLGVMEIVACPSSNSRRYWPPPWGAAKAGQPTSLQTQHLKYTKQQPQWKPGSHPERNSTVCHQPRATECTHLEVVVSALSFNDNKPQSPWFQNLWLTDIEGAKVQEKLCGVSVLWQEKDGPGPFYSVRIY